MDYQKSIPDIINELTATPYMVHVGTFKDVYIEASANERSFILWHNLGGAHVPTKNEAHRLLSVLEEFYLGLAVSETFRTFLGERQLEIELYVSSGQMDLSVATKKAGLIDWKLDLG
jgi:hypothetical protein